MRRSKHILNQVALNNNSDVITISLGPVPYHYEPLILFEIRITYLDKKVLLNPLFSHTLLVLLLSNLKLLGEAEWCELE